MNESTLSLTTTNELTSPISSPTSQPAHDAEDMAVSVGLDTR